MEMISIPDPHIVVVGDKLVVFTGEDPMPLVLRLTPTDSDVANPHQTPKHFSYDGLDDG